MWYLEQLPLILALEVGELGEVKCELLYETHTIRGLIELTISIRGGLLICDYNHNFTQRMAKSLSDYLDRPPPYVKEWVQVYQRKRSALRDKDARRSWAKAGSKRTRSRERCDRHSQHGKLLS